MNETELKWGIKIDKLDVPNMWSFGACISHWGDETYLSISLIFVTVYIGKMGC